VLEIKGMSEFKPPAPIAEFFDARKTSTVTARFGSLAQGAIEVTTVAKGKYRIKKQSLLLTHPALTRVKEFAPGLTPALSIGVDESNKVKGEVVLAAGQKVERISQHIQKMPEIVGLSGFTIGTLPTITNTIEGGSLHLGLKGVPIKLGSAFSGKFDLDLIDTAVSFTGNVAIAVKGLANGTLNLQRAHNGLITGRAAVGLTLPKNLSGNVDVAWDGMVITGIGKVGYTGEKFSGEVTLQMMEKNQAESLAKAKKAPPAATPQPAPTISNKTPARIDYVVFGEGDLTFSFTEWLNGTAHVIIDPKGNLTVIGEIKPQKEFILFEQKDYIRPLFKFEARAAYGIPVVGNVFIFANVGMDLFAKLGPAKFYNIVIAGTYSTDPAVAKNFSIRGSLNISAGAGVRLRAEAGVGLEILAHDIKAGAGLMGIAAIKAYAEATPQVGYREKAAEGQDLKGEWFIRGDLEIAAQPFLGLSGDLFVEIDAPWWSPVPDKKWTWPLFSKEWPLGGSLGMLVSVDYVFGSGQWPKFDLKPVEFDSNKFMTGLYEDKAKSGSGKELEQKGKWQEKNAGATTAPPKTSPKGSASPGKLETAPGPKSKRVAGGGRSKDDRKVDPHAKSKDGKTVKQLQDEAKKKGKGPKGKDLRSDYQKVSDLGKAIAESRAEMTKSGASVKTVKAKLMAIQARYQLNSIVLVKDKEDRYHVKAVINPILEGPTGVLFTPEELAELDKVAKQYVAHINKKESQKSGFKAAAMADLQKFIKLGGNVETGKMVEAMASPPVEQLAKEAKLTVIKGAFMKWVDAGGEQIGGMGPELDFLIVGAKGVHEILSAKFKVGRIDVANDVAHLTAFQTMPTGGPALVALLTGGKFGKNKDFPRVVGVNVVSNLGEMSLAVFRAKYLSQIPVRQILITPLQPAPEKATGLQLRVTREELVQKTAELMRKYL
jgi:ribosomal protein L10